MKWRLPAALAPLVIVILIPVMLRRENVVDDPTADQLVIVSPHNEAIRYEFENAFRTHYRERTGRDADIDWRTPGGTSEIVRYIRSTYTAAFREAWQNQGQAWTPEIQAAFLNRKLTQAEASEQAWTARNAFLDSDIGIEIDLFFGGGQYDFGKFAAMGILVPGGVRERHPELFEGEKPILHPGLSGETWVDSEDRYYGACLSSFGICYNIDALERLGGPTRRTDPPFSRWDDLAHPALIGRVGVADPSKSGSITKCFEMLIQQKMSEVLVQSRAQAHDGPPTDEQHKRALSRGWQEAMLLIRKIGGNASYFTFSASKVPVDVANGHIAAGMCIDFYGRSQAEWETRHVGRKTMVYVTPEGGSSVSADPIGMLRGAPHPQIAEMFLDFVLSKEGQRLWNYRPGTPGGPDHYAIRRLPVRRDLYTTEDREQMSDPEAEPFQLAERFTYKPAWTGPLFGLIRILIRVMIIDCHEELEEAWKAIVAAGGPEKNPEAMALLAELPFSYSESREAAQQIRNPEQAVVISRRWGAFFRERYRAATRSAKTSAAKPRSGR